MSLLLRASDIAGKAGGKTERKPVPARILAVKREYAEVYSYWVKPEPDNGIGPFQAGQFIHLTAPGGRICKEDVRHMSIATPPGEKVLLFSMNLASGSSYKERFRQARAGDRLTLFGIAGDLTLRHLTPGITPLFIAGGVGITPMRSMIHELARKGKKSFWTLLHVGRDHLYRKETSVLGGNSYYTGRSGIQEHLDRIFRDGVAQKLFYVSGSDRFVLDVSRMLQSRGIDRRRIVTEGPEH